MSSCHIIGVLDNGIEGLTPEALAYIKEADVVIGGDRTLALFADQIGADAAPMDLGGRLGSVPAWIETALESGQQVVVLATGDPLCHGIGKYLLGKLGAGQCRVLPNVSTLQLACARFGLPLQEMKITSVHSHDAGEWQPGAGPEHGLYALRQQINQHPQLAIFTSPENSPARIARMLISEGLDEQWQLHVAEKLLCKDEQLYSALTPQQAAETDFAEPNVVLLINTQTQAKPVTFGLADDSFQQRKPDKGLITKREVRAVSLARMQLRPDSIVWDIGAGSGSVGLEAARLAAQGHVYAIEKNEADAANALENRRRLAVSNYTLVNDKAPAQLEAWPDPDAIFIGGSGGELATLIELCLQRLRPNGWLVMNFVTLENLTTAIEALKQSDACWDVTQLSAARSVPVLHMQRMAAENPVWIISANKITDKAVQEQINE